MDDERFLQAIAATLADDHLRLVYADWLEERGDRRAAFMRIESELAKLAANDVRFPEVPRRLRELGAHLETRWVAQVSRMAIENCEVSFKFRCPKKWESLRPTADESVRFCDSCSKQVFFCNTISVAQTHGFLGDCVAVDPRLVRESGDMEVRNDEEDGWTMGLPATDEYEDPDARWR